MPGTRGQTVQNADIPDRRTAGRGRHTRPRPVARLRLRRSNSVGDKAPRGVRIARHTSIAKEFCGPRCERSDLGAFGKLRVLGLEFARAVHEQNHTVGPELSQKISVGSRCAESKLRHAAYELRLWNMKGATEKCVLDESNVRIGNSNGSHSRTVQKTKHSFRTRRAAIVRQLGDASLDVRGRRLSKRVAPEEVVVLRVGYFE